MTDPSDLARALLTVDNGAQATSSPASVAAAVDAIWTRLATHFSRLIGDAGVQAVLERSIAIASVHSPWLVASSRPEDGVRSLRAAFEAQSVPTAIDGFGDLVTTFIALLGRFIGDGLVKRLLAEVWPTVFPLVPKESP